MTSRKQQGAWIPGFFLPLKWQQEEDRAPRHSYNTFLNSALDGSEEGYEYLYCKHYYLHWRQYSGDGSDPLTVVERLMLSLMNEITDDFGWVPNVSDKQYIDEWKRQTLSRYANISPQITEWVRYDLSNYNDQADSTAVCSRSARKSGSFSRITNYPCSRSRSI